MNFCQILSIRNFEERLSSYGNIEKEEKRTKLEKEEETEGESNNDNNVRLPDLYCTRSFGLRKK